MIFLVISENWGIMSSIGSILSGIFTLLLFLIGWNQISKFVSTRELDLYYKLKQDFNSLECKELLRCIVVNNLTVKNDVYGYPSLFDLENSELSDDLLNHIEDMCIFFDNGLIQKKTMIEGYGRVINDTFTNQTIHDYIRVKRLFFSTPSLHTGLDKLYKIINE
jgi:hypothetical protein